MHLTEPQRALLGYISAGQEAIIRAEEELRTKVSLCTRKCCHNLSVKISHRLIFPLWDPISAQSNGEKTVWITANKRLLLIFHL